MIKYYVPPIYGLHNATISKVSIIRDIGPNTVNVSFEEGAHGNCLMDKKYLFDTPEQALEQLAHNILDFKAKLDYSMEQARLKMEKEHGQRESEQPNTG